ncbi:hypothetical protein ACFVT5_04985 [Streptomyces sp. NPDC058001]|uniref:hypothetical protein n=1 Tax=Streptomyces sp. NPDC058001 TaxID=3346300 RepID=UPI0036EF5E45
MTGEQEGPLGPQEYKARGGIVRTQVPGEVLTASPAARRAAEEAGRELRFDFLDDAAVLKLLRLRHLDDVQLHNVGMRWRLPVILVVAAPILYWGAYVQYWESSRSQTLYYAAAGAVMGAVVCGFAVAAVREWSHRGWQKVRARAAAYRNIAHIAARNGTELPDFYPHYGPYPFAANFHADAEELDLPDEETTA